MEVDTIARDVEETVQDAQYNATWAIGKFNECLLLLATMCRIPGLQMTAVVNVPVNETTAVLPKTFLHDLFLATTPTYPNGILIAPNIKELTVSYSDMQKGPVQSVCLDGKVLSFRPNPEIIEGVTLHFYGKPKELSAGDVFPDYIPEILHKEIFLNYALKEAYLKIEDGLDGVMPNTQKYNGLTTNGIAMLVAFYPNAPKARPAIQRSRVEF